MITNFISSLQLCRIVVILYKQGNLQIKIFTFLRPVDILIWSISLIALCQLLQMLLIYLLLSILCTYSL